MLITKRSICSGKINVMEIPCTEKDIFRWKASGEKNQDAFPRLTTDQREFLMTGCTPEEWDEIFDKDLDEIFGSGEDW